ncbi:MAG: HAMP domain-containing histidine kinase [Kiritimatiellae bacterium]|nr:HAMP domain-containing histidine kinase [Kiritimatiellia bacterium]
MACSTVLAFFSLRSLKYEEILFERDLDERGDAIAVGVEEQVRRALRLLEAQAQAAVAGEDAGEGAAEMMERLKPLGAECAFVMGPDYRPRRPRSPWRERAADGPESEPPGGPAWESYAAAEAQEFQGRTYQALQAYEQLVLEADSKRYSANVLNARARCRRKTGHDEQALDLYGEICRDYPFERAVNGACLGAVAYVQCARIHAARESFAACAGACADLLRLTLLPEAGLSKAQAAFYEHEVRGLVASIRKRGLAREEDLAAPRALMAELGYLRACEELGDFLKMERIRREVDGLIRRGLSHSLDPGEYRSWLEQVEHVLAAEEVQPGPEPPSAAVRAEGGEGAVYLVFRPGQFLGYRELAGRPGHALVFSFPLATLRRLILEQVRLALRFAGDFDFRITDAAGEVTVQSGAAHAAEAGIKRSLAWLVPGWNLAVAVPHSGGLHRAVRSRMALNVGIVAILVLAIGISMFFMLRMIREERELSAMKTDFISTVSHELRTPVTTLKMVTEMFEMGAVKDHATAREYLITLEEETERLSMLINNLLDFSRMDSGRKKYAFGPQDIGLLVADTVRTFRKYAKAKGYDIQLYVQPRLPECAIDADAIVQVLLNLLDNAVKYSPVNKEIMVNVFVEGPFVNIQVVDRGRGIDNSKITRIFERFYRGDDEIVKEVKGSGVGLAIVKEIVTAHNGKVHVVSEKGEGRGSTFTVMLPALEGSDHGADSDC